MAKLEQQSVTIEHQTDLIQDLRKENRVSEIFTLFHGKTLIKYFAMINPCHFY